MRLQLSDLNDAGAMEWLAWTRGAMIEIERDSLKECPSGIHDFGDCNCTAERDIEEISGEFLDHLSKRPNLSSLVTEEARVRLMLSKPACVLHSWTHGDDEGNHTCMACGATMKEKPADPNAECKAAFKRGERIEFWSHQASGWLCAVTPTWNSQLQYRVAK